MGPPDRFSEDEQGIHRKIRKCKPGFGKQGPNETHSSPSVEKGPSGGDQPQAEVIPLRESTSGGGTDGPTGYGQNVGELDALLEEKYSTAANSVPVPPFSGQLKQGAKVVCASNAPTRFDDKQERRTNAILNRAIVLQNRLKESEGSMKNACFSVDTQLALIKKQWPVLFGQEPSKIYVHLDMDSFFASVETLDKPEYANLPMGVGSKMMLAAANYKAREYGIRAGMAGYKARHLCPGLVFQRPDFEKYAASSKAVVNILSMYDPEVEVYGLDEVCMIFDEPKLIAACGHYNSQKITGMDEMFVAPARANGLGDDGETCGVTTRPLVYRGFSMDAVAEIVEKIRHVVYRNTGLTISAGISVCRGLAKYSSNIRKPNGQYAVEKDFDGHLLGLPVDKINGIGKATKEVLERAFGIITVGDLRSKLHLCATTFKPKTFSSLFRLSYGLSRSDSKSSRALVRRPALSHGMSLTVTPTVSSKDILFYLWNFSTALYEKTRMSASAATSVTLTLKFASFDAITKGRGGLPPIKAQIDLFEFAVCLMDQCFARNGPGCWNIDRKIRLVGITVGGFVPLKGLDPLKKYVGAPVTFKYKECIICKAVFIHETQAVYELHVNRCIDSTAEKPRKVPKSLLDYFRK